MKKKTLGGISVRYKDILRNKFFNVGKFKLKYMDREITRDFFIPDRVLFFSRKQINEIKDYFVRWYIYKLYNSSVPRSLSFIQRWQTVTLRFRRQGSQNSWQGLLKAMMRKSRFI